MRPYCTLTSICFTFFVKFLKGRLKVVYQKSSFVVEVVIVRNGPLEVLLLDIVAKLNCNFKIVIITTKVCLYSYLIPGLQRSNYDCLVFQPL